jgi:hypothetical protein
MSCPALRVAMLSVVLTAAACGAEVPPPPAATAAGPVPAATAAPGATAPGPRATHVVVERADGPAAAQVSTRYAPLAEPLQACAPGTGGVVRVRVEKHDQQTRITVEPGTTSAAAGHCALETLSTVEADDSASHASPANRPSGFSALLRLEW